MTLRTRAMQKPIHECWKDFNTKDDAGTLRKLGLYSTQGQKVVLSELLNF